MTRILAQMGVHAVDEQGRPCAVQVTYTQDWHLWECNVRVWQLWISVQTQWLHGMAGPTGLNYAGVWSVIDRQLPRRQRDEAFGHIQAMESAALLVWAKRPDQHQQ